MNHTPGPWQFESKSNYDDGNLWIVGKDRSICRIDMPDPEDKANAEFIVRACNAHEELVALLKRARYYLKTDHSIPCTDLMNEIDAFLPVIEKGA